MTVTSQRSEVEGDMFNWSHAVLRISLAVLSSWAEKWQLLPSLVWITRGTGQSEQRHSSVNLGLAVAQTFLCSSQVEVLG